MFSPFYSCMCSWMLIVIWDMETRRKMATYNGRNMSQWLLGTREVCATHYAACDVCVCDVCVMYVWCVVCEWYVCVICVWCMCVMCVCDVCVCDVMCVWCDVCVICVCDLCVCDLCVMCCLWVIYVCDVCMWCMCDVLCVMLCVVCVWYIYVSVDLMLHCIHHDTMLTKVTMITSSPHDHHWCSPDAQIIITWCSDDLIITWCSDNHHLMLRSSSSPDAQINITTWCSDHHYHLMFRSSPPDVQIITTSAQIIITTWCSDHHHLLMLHSQVQMRLITNIISYCSRQHRRETGDALMLQIWTKMVSWTRRSMESSFTHVRHACMLWAHFCWRRGDMLA